MPQTLTPAPEGKPKRPKAEQIAHERETLLSQLAAERLTTTRVRVAFILNYHPEARNSDRILFLKYWETFQPEVLGPDHQVDKGNVLLLENPMTLTRDRQKIQNEYGLFQPSDEIRAFRSEREAEFKEAAVFDRPDLPITGVFCDESGKNDGYLLVGSVWTLDPHRQAQLMVHLLQFKSQRNLNMEFHFSGISRKNLEHTKAYFLEALSRSDTLSFKAIAVRTKGLSRPIADLTMDLYRHLVTRGLEHEFSTGRLTPPRLMQVWKDKEDGVDALQLEGVRQKLIGSLRDQFGDNATLQMLEPVDSKGNYLVQLADLFTGSINRVLNGAGEAPNHKDEFAHFVLDSLGIHIAEDGTVDVGDQDIATLIVLPS